MIHTGNEKENTIREAILSDQSHKEEWKFEIFENGGVVTLTGSVPSQEDFRKIESIAMEQPGVFTVINELQVEKGENDSEDNVQIVPPGK